MTESDWCLIPCLFCGGGLKNCFEGQNQPAGGTEFVGGGAYGSTITDHGGFSYVINLCDACLKDAVTSKHVLKRFSARQRAPQHSYELLTDVGDHGHRIVTEEELLAQLKHDKLQDACSSLSDKLFLYKPAAGYLAMSDDHIIVFAKGSKSSWQDVPMDIWEGYPVEWRFDCGEVTTEGPG